MSSAEPVGYMERTRAYYAAQGYPKSYTWAQNDAVPWSRPARPLAKARLALITTASPLAGRAAGEGTGDGGTLLLRKRVASGSVDENPGRLFTDDLSWDKETTHTEDLGSYFPLETLRGLVADSELGALAARYHCVPTEYSQRQTIEQDAPLIRERVLEDGADIALLVPL